MKVHQAPTLNELSSLVGGLSLETPIKIGEVSFVPLICKGPGPNAELLEEAQEGGRALIEELDRDGSVNVVVVKNEGGTLLLLIDGEQIIGAKQNRTINASFLVPPGESAQIPVSCVEKNRWSYKSERFAGSGRTVVGSVRKAKLQRVSKSVVSGAGYDAKQGEVWDDVDKYLERTCISSPTSALADAEEARSSIVEDRIHSLVPIDDQVGFAAVRGDELLGIDLMGSAGLYQRAWRKLVRGVLVDVYEGESRQADPIAVVNRALDAVRSASIVRHDAPGCGQTLATDSDKVAFTAIAHDGHIYHAAIAPADG